MRRTILLLVFLVSGLGSCYMHRGMQGGMAGGTDHAMATRLQEVYSDIAGDYDSLLTRRSAIADELPEEEGHLFEAMSQMHERADRVHGHMMSGGMADAGVGGVREWDLQMMAMHERMSLYHRRHGHREMMAMHEHMMRSYRRALDVTEGVQADGGPSTPPTGSPNGEDLFFEECASCHGAQGRGMGDIFPPLARSEWVTGEKEVLVGFILHGIEGSIDVAGTTYAGIMPGFAARLSDEEIAAILTYIRSSWGNSASPVTVRDVNAVRRANHDRKNPWTPSELP